MKAMRAAILFLAVATASAALANDSTATVGAGGLVLQKTASIAMRSEDLYLSVDEVRVGYVFRNITAVPVTSVVAFPMPPRPLAEEYGGDVAYPSHFRTMADGTPVRATLERKAVAKGKDQRARLEALGIPVAPDSISAATKVMDALPPARKYELIRLGLASEEQWDDTGKGMKKHLVPLWTVEDRYWWTQLFPPGRDVRIDHRYVPGAGGSVDSAIASPQFRETADSKAMIAHYCIDGAFLTAVDKLSRKDKKRGPGMPDRRVDYILATGSNWARPIGRFRLVVDKKKLGNLVSFCGDDVRKISPTQFEMVKTNWRPDRDLSVLMIEPQGR